MPMPMLESGAKHIPITGEGGIPSLSADIERSPETRRLTSEYQRRYRALAEFLLAKSLHKQIFGVILKDIPIGELPTEMTSEWELCRLIGTGPTDTIRFRHRDSDDSIAFLSEGLGRLKAGLKKAGLSADFFPWPPKDEPCRSRGWWDSSGRSCGRSSGSSRCSRSCRRSARCCRGCSATVETEFATQGWQRHVRAAQLP